jgi:hypothetical protein
MSSPYAAAVPLGVGDPNDKLIAKLFQIIAEQDGRISALERAHVTAIALVSAGVPSFTPTQSGVIYLDTTGTKLGAYTPTGWKSVGIA